MGKNAEDLFQGPPLGTQQEITHADLSNSRDAVGEQENADQRHRQYGNTGGDEENPLHNFLFHLFHTLSPVTGQKGLRIAPLSPSR